MIIKNVELTARRISARVIREANKKRPRGRRGWPDLSTIEFANTYDTDNHPEYRQKALHLLDEFGIQYDETVSPKEQIVHWTGGKLALAKQNVSNILHELAHYQVAPPSWRRLPEFGIGVGPDGGWSKDASARYPKVDCRPVSTPEGAPWGDMPVLEECRASLLGILWERKLGGPWRRTLEHHSWVLGKKGSLVWENSDIDYYLSFFLRHGLIDGHGHPKPLALRRTDDE